MLRTEAPAVRRGVRLPGPFRARWHTAQGYANAAALAAVIPGGFLALLGLSASVWMLVLSLVVAIGVPWLAAYRLWPRKRPRTAGRMAMRGAAVVLISLLAGSMLFGLLSAIGNFAHLGPLDLIQQVIGMIMVGVVFGSLFTLGLPWWLGIGLSLMFPDPPDAQAGNEQGTPA